MTNSIEPNLNQNIRTLNALTRQFVKLKSMLPLEEITRTRLEIGVQGENILVDSYHRLDDSLENFKDLQTQNINRQKAFHRVFQESVAQRKKESNDIANNFDNVIKPNPSTYFQDNKLEDEIQIFSQRKREIKSYQTSLKSIKNEILILDLRLTPIHKKIFAEEIKEFQEGINTSIEKLEIFENELEQDLENIQQLLNLLEKTYRDNGYSRTTQKAQVWIDEYLKSTQHQSPNVQN